MTRGVVSSGILECRSPGKVINNYTIGSGIEVNPEIHKFDLKKVELRLKIKNIMR